MLSGIQISVDAVAVIAAIFGSAAFIYRKLILPMYRWTSSMVESLDKINVIHEQMFTNGGSTLRDAVNRIENRINLVEKKQGIYILDTPHGVYESNSNGEITSVNRTLCRITGKTENEILGNGWLTSISENDRERVDDAWNYAIGNQIEFLTTYDMVSSDGDIFKVRTHANPIKSSDGRLMGYIGVVDRVNG
jgi:PAS domain S-box-containing protein